MIIYTKDACGYCVKAKALAKQRGIEYREMKLGVDVTREEVVSLFPNARTFPIIVIDGEVVGGYAEFAAL
jgi:glutaredoxin 3